MKTASNKSAPEQQSTDWQEILVYGEILPDSSGKQSIKVRKVGVEGKTLIDIRKFLKTERYTGRTAQGITLDLSGIEELRDTLSEVLAQEAARAEKKAAKKARTKA